MGIAITDSGVSTLLDVITQSKICGEECDHPGCEYLRVTQKLTHEHGLGFTTQEQYADQMEGAATHLLHRLNATYSVRV